MDNSEFDLSEYILFGLFIVTAVIITIYAAIVNRRKKRETKEVMGLLPLSLSLFATNVSSLIFGGAPNEVYQYGLTIILNSLPSLLSIFLLVYVQIPSMYELKLKSLNEYLEKRFNLVVRNISLMLNILHQVIASTSISYGMALFLSELSGIRDMTIFKSTVAFLVVYTVLGGFRGVVLTEAFQALAMFLASMTLLIFGTWRAGGIAAVFNAALEGDRLSIDWDLDPTKRLTGWITMFWVGTSTFGRASLFDPALYQRYVAMKTERDAKLGAIFQCVSSSLINALMAILGLVMYAVYQGCDPVSSHEVNRYDQIIARFVWEMGKSAKLVRGIFIVGYLSAGMSTVATLFNTFSEIMYNDFMTINFKWSLKHPIVIKQCLVVLKGLIITALCYMLKDTGSILDMLTLSATAVSVYGALFSMGFFMPAVNSKGAIVGGIVASAVTLSMAYGSKRAISQGFISYPSKPMRTDQCFNATIISKMTRNVEEQDVFYLFRISSFYHGAIGFILAIIVGYVVSKLTKGNNWVEKDRKLVCTMAQSLIPNYQPTPFTDSDDLCKSRRP